jgi:hypothetical protein
LIADSLHRMHGLEPDLAEFEKQIELLDKKLDVYDSILSKQKYLAGDVRFSFPRCMLILEEKTHPYVAAIDSCRPLPLGQR